MLTEARKNLEWCDGTLTLLASLHRLRPEPVRGVLIHGDLALDNVLVAAEDAMSLIDWSGGGQGERLRRRTSGSIDAKAVREPLRVLLIQHGTFARNFLARAASVVSHWISRSVPVRNKSIHSGGSTEKSIVWRPQSGRRPS